MSVFTDDHLATELAFFDQKRNEWCKQGHSGKYVVIKGTAQLGHFHKRFEDAMASAYQAKCDEGEFLVEKVLASDATEWVSHIEPGSC